MMVKAFWISFLLLIVSSQPRRLAGFGADAWVTPKSTRGLSLTAATRRGSRILHALKSPAGPNPITQQEIRATEPQQPKDDDENETPPRLPIFTILGRLVDTTEGAPTV
jgi:hypothetical protein